MFGQSEDNDYQPFGYIGRIPLYVTTILVIAYAVAMVVFTLLVAGHVVDAADYLRYDSVAVRAGFQFWRFVTYPLVNGPSIWFVLELWVLYSFGREVERFIGRTAYGMLYFSMVVLSPCLLTAISTITHQLCTLEGSWLPDFGVLIAFATIYPNTEVFFSIKSKWIAAILAGITSLQLLAVHDLLGVAMLWATCGAAFLFIKYLRGHLQFSIRDYFRRRRSRRNLRAMPGPRSLPKARKPAAPKDDVIESIDPLLDKIAKHGIGSLTAREREKLEQARAELLKKPAP